MDRLAVVMAAGEGVRMCSQTPKMLHQVCGIAMVEHVMRALDPVCREQIVVVGASHERLSAHYKGQAEFIRQAPDGFGTGWAVKSVASRLRGRQGVALVIPGDKPLIQSETLARLVSEVESGSCAAAVLTARVDNPFGSARVIRESGTVRAVVDQKDLKADQLGLSEICRSVYAFDVEKLLRALDALEPDGNGDYHLSGVIAMFSENGEIVRGVPSLEPQEGMGVNDRVQLAEAERLMRARINRRHMLRGVTMIDPERVYIQPDVLIGRDTVIHPDCEIGRGCVIGEGCLLRAGCQIAFSRVGDGCVIGGSLLRHAVVESGVRLEKCVINGATVEKDRVVEPFTVIRG